MLRELVQACGNERRACPILGISRETLDTWLAGDHNPTAAGFRVVWLIHCLYFHPAKLSSPFHIATWGKFIDPDKLKPPLDDWSI